MLVDILPLPFVVSESPLLLLDVEIFLHPCEVLFKLRDFLSSIAQDFTEIVFSLFELKGFTVSLSLIEAKLLDRVTHFNKLTTKLDISHPLNLLVEFIFLKCFDLRIIEHIQC